MIISWEKFYLSSPNDFKLDWSKILINCSLWKWLTLYHIILTFNDLGKESFWKHCGKKKHFLLFPQCFLPFPKQILILWSHLFCCLQMLKIWTDVKFCRLVKSWTSKGLISCSLWKRLNKYRMEPSLVIYMVFDLVGCNSSSSQFYNFFSDY